MSSVYVKTLGCKVNEYDSSVIKSLLLSNGFALVDDVKEADLAVINSCCVTNNAEKEARYLMRFYKRQNPFVRVVLCGCYAQAVINDSRGGVQADLIIPNTHKLNTVEIIAEYVNHNYDSSGYIFDKKQFDSKVLFGSFVADKTRATVKVQDGCNAQCSYCIVPAVRGRSRSVPSLKILEEIRRLGEAGIKEVVLTGIHLGQYGRDLDEFVSCKEPLTQLLSSLFELGTFLPRIRLSSLESDELSENMVKLLWQNKDKFCDHFHLPLQSGSNDVLKKMNRRYASTKYLETLHLVRQYFPAANVGADVIVGFPSESDSEFQKTCDFISDSSLNYLHVFPYSERPNTKALEFKDQAIPIGVIKERAGILRKLSNTLVHDYLVSCLHQTYLVLWENTLTSTGKRVGRAANYVEVILDDESSNVPSQGQMSLVKTKQIADNTRLIASFSNNPV